MEEEFNLTPENYESFIKENEISTFSIYPKPISIRVFQAKEDIPLIRSIRKPNQVVNVAFSVATKGQFVALAPDAQLWIMDRDWLEKNYEVI